MRGLFLFLIACGAGDEGEGPTASTSTTPTGTSATTGTTSPPTSTVPTTTTPTSPTSSGAPRVRMMLHGGGPEEEALYTRFVEAAGFGHIVTLGAREDDDPYLLYFDTWWPTLGAASAETLNVRTPAEADDPAVTAALEAADAVYIRGGDQAMYVDAWVGTPLEDALVAAFERGAVIGGTSAGCAILGGRIYDARVSSVDSWEALLDPYDPGITFSPAIFDFLPHVLTDTHFTERGRLGRLSVFTERWELDGGVGVVGLGVDPETALFVYDDLTAEVAGRGSVTLLDPGPAASTLAPGDPPDIRGQRFWQLPAGYVIDLADLADPVVTRPAWVTPTAAAAGLDGWTSGRIDGSEPLDRRLGEWMIPNLDASVYGWYDGELVLEAGDGALPGALVVSGLYESSDYDENHQGGMGWFLAQHPEAVAVGVDIYLQVGTEPPATLTAGANSYALVLDGRSATHTGLPPVVDWQTAAIEGATLIVVGAGEGWDGAVLP